MTISSVTCLPTKMKIHLKRFTLPNIGTVNKLYFGSCFMVLPKSFNEVIENKQYYRYS